MDGISSGSYSVSGFDMRGVELSDFAIRALRLFCIENNNGNESFGTALK